MRSSSVIAASAALVAGANAWASNVTYTTEVLTAYTTYCPSSTEVVHGSKTYTVTEATTLTITDCPCTITKPAYTPVPVISTTPVVISSSSVPVVYTSPVESTTPAETTPVESTTIVESSTPVFTTPVVTVPVGTGFSTVPVGTSVVPQPSISPPVYVNSTIPGATSVVVPPPVIGTGTAAPSAGVPTTTSHLPAFTGAASKAFSASGAGLLAVFGLAAYAL